MGTKGSLFRYADWIDKLLLLFGTLGSIGDGLMTPLTMFTLSLVINEYGVSDLSLSNEIVDKVSIVMVIMSFFFLFLLLSLWLWFSYA